MPEPTIEQREILVRPAAGRVSFEVRAPDGEVCYGCDLSPEDAAWLGHTLVRAAKLADAEKRGG